MLEAISSKFEGDWSVSVVEFPENPQWNIRLTAPNGAEQQRDLDVSERNARAVQNNLLELKELALKVSTGINPLLKSIHIKNLLSFDGMGCSVELTSLNVLIGPNGSGKSNLLEIVGVLHNVPRDFAEPIRRQGGIKEWLWKGSTSSRSALAESPIATIEAVVDLPFEKVPIRYHLSFAAVGYQIEVDNESIQTAWPPQGRVVSEIYFGYEDGIPVISSKGPNPVSPRVLNPVTITSKLSVLAQLKDPGQYPEMTYLERQFDSLRLYRDWEFGARSAARNLFPADLPDDYLREDLSNFGLMLSRLTAEPSSRRNLIESLRLFYPDAVDLRPKIVDGRVEIRLEEKSGFSTPASRLSDGTLKWLALLVILLNPNPAPLVCIEEPELGLHPDMIPALAKLLKDASERMQLIVTTHSADLVEEFSDAPECVLVCEKYEGATRINRLKQQELASWLQRYSLGELWRKGEIGGNRW